MRVGRPLVGANTRHFGVAVISKAIANRLDCEQRRYHSIVGAKAAPYSHLEKSKLKSRMHEI